MLCIHEEDESPNSSILFDIILFFVVFPYLLQHCTSYTLSLFILVSIHIYISIMRYVYNKRVVWNVLLEPIALIIAATIVYNKCYIIGSIMFIVHLYRMISGQNTYNYIIDKRHSKD